jgi:hypothetical protein
MAEDRGPHGPGYEAYRVDQEGLERTDQRVGLRKEELGEDEAGNGAVKEEVVPLDRGADRAGDDGAGELGPVLGLGQRAGSGGDGGRHGACLLIVRRSSSWIIGAATGRKSRLSPCRPPGVSRFVSEPSTPRGEVHLPKSWKGKHYGNERSGAHPSSIDGITEARITFPGIAINVREVIGQFDPRQPHPPIGVGLRVESCRSVQKSDCHVKLIT